MNKRALLIAIPLLTAAALLICCFIPKTERATAAVRHSIASASFGDHMAVASAADFAVGSAYAVPDFSENIDLMDEIWDRNCSTQYPMYSGDELKMRRLSMAGLGNVNYVYTDGKQVLFSRQNKSGGSYDLLLWDTVSGNTDLIFTSDSPGYKIHDPILTSDGIYWIVASDTIDVNTGIWQLYFCSLPDMSVAQVRAFDDNSAQLLTPRLTAAGGAIFWIEGVEHGGAPEYSVYRLNSDSAPEVLFHFHYLYNPYYVLHISSGYLSVLDYYDSAWRVVIFDLESSSLLTYTITELLDGEYPVYTVFNGDVLAYSTSYSQLYLHSADSPQAQAVGYADYGFDIVGNYLFHQNRGTVCAYDIASGQNSYLVCDESLTPVAAAVNDGLAFFLAIPNGDFESPLLFTVTA